MPPLSDAAWQTLLNGHLQTLKQHCEVLNHVTTILHPETPETAQMIVDVRSMYVATEQQIAQTRKLRQYTNVASPKRSPGSGVRPNRNTSRTSPKTPPPPSSSQGSRENRLFISNIPLGAGDVQVRALFADFRVTSIEIATSNTHPSKHATIELIDKEEHNRAFKALMNVKIGRQRLKIQSLAPQKETPSSMVKRRGSDSSITSIDRSPKKWRHSSPIGSPIEEGDVADEVQRRLREKEERRQRRNALLTPRLGKRTRSIEDSDLDRELEQEGLTPRTAKKSRIFCSMG